MKKMYNNMIDRQEAHMIRTIVQRMLESIFRFVDRKAGERITGDIDLLLATVAMFNSQAKIDPWFASWFYQWKEPLLLFAATKCNGAVKVSPQYCGDYGMMIVYFETIYDQYSFHFPDGLESEDWEVFPSLDIKWDGPHDVEELETKALSCFLDFDTEGVW